MENNQEKINKLAREYAISIIERAKQADSGYRQALEHMSAEEIEVALQYYMAIYRGGANT